MPFFTQDEFEKIIPKTFMTNSLYLLWYVFAAALPFRLFSKSTMGNSCLIVTEHANRSCIIWFQNIRKVINPLCQLLGSVRGVPDRIWGRSSSNASFMAKRWVSVATAHNCRGRGQQSEALRPQRMHTVVWSFHKVDRLGTHTFIWYAWFKNALS